MKPGRTIPLLVGYLLFTPRVATPQCTTVINSWANFDFARVVIEPSAQGLATGIQRGMASWNDSPCVNRYINPYPYPEFYTGSFGEPVIRVRLADHLGSSGHSIAQIAINRDTGNATLTLFGKIVALDGSIVPIDWSDPEMVSDAVAHELGHYLGLDESPCLPHIMSYATGDVFQGKFVFGTYSEVQSEECWVTDQNNISDWEENEIACQQDITCNPDAPCGPFCCPILLDLDRDGFRLSAGPVDFDIDANGTIESLGWTRRGEKDAFLALDRNGNGLIDDGAELFGSGTPVGPDGEYKAPHGYIALRELDRPEHGGNDDGWLTEKDQSFESLLLWWDRNQNGVSEPRELVNAAEAGLVAIDLTVFPYVGEDGFGNDLRYASRAWIRQGRNLREILTVDAFFVRH